MKAIAFDLGDTLVEYEGLPLSWEEHYPEALRNLAAFLGISADSDHLVRACAVLRRYNTRIIPRAEEVSFEVILGELIKSLGATVQADEVECAVSFFHIFRQRLRCFPETRAAVDGLREKNLKVGIFTDVPYGMPRQLVLEDVRGAGLEHSFDVLMTSRDAGFRKPSVATLGSLAKLLDCSAGEMAYVGNEKKDVEVALAFGCHSILIDRKQHGSDWGQHRTITSLSEL